MIFLDAGNTILSMDYEILSRWMESLGTGIDPNRLARAEAAARPALSRYLASGNSTEASASLEVYVSSMLEVTQEGESPDGELLHELLSKLHQPGNWDRLWSRVPDGVPGALRALGEAGLGRIVVSNADGTVDRKLESVGLLPLVDAIVDSSKLGSEKPDPEIFRHAVRLAGARPEECLHVGDLYSVDVLGARAAGVHAVLLDPYDDWTGHDCARVRDVPELVTQILEGR